MMTRLSSFCLCVCYLYGMVMGYGSDLAERYTHVFCILRLSGLFARAHRNFKNASCRELRWLFKGLFGLCLSAYFGVLACEFLSVI
jgi:hypothetical protein